MSLPWRKRMEYRLLRWQARFEGVVFNRTAPWFFALGLGVVLLLIALARSRELSEEQGLASAMQATWLIGDGFTPDASLLPQNYLFEQAGFLIYPVALLASILPTAITLLAIQSAALALGAVPIWKIARNIANLRIGTTMAIVVAYAAYSAIHVINIGGFHLEALALPSLLAAVYSGMRDRWIRYAIFAVLAVSARADLGLALSALGAFWWLEGKRRAGWITAVSGLTWFLVALLVIQPAYAGGDFPHVDAFAAYGGDDPAAVLWGVITSPITFLQELFSQANFLTVVSLLAPVLFLPAVAPRYLLPAVPLYCLYLVADVPVDELDESGQLVPITAFVFVALIFGIAKTGRVVVQRVNVDRRLVGALVFTAAVFFVRDAVTSPYEEPWSWGRRDAGDGLRLDAADLIPDDAVVRAAPKLLPLVTERVGLFALDLPDDADADAVVLADGAAENVNWIVFDSSEVPQWDGLRVERFCTRLRLSGWVAVLSDSFPFTPDDTDDDERRSGSLAVFTFEDIARSHGLEPIAAADGGC